MPTDHEREERHLRILARRHFGDVVDLATTVLRGREVTLVIEDGPVRSTVGLGADSRLWCRVERAGTAAYGVVGDDGRVTPLAEGPVGGSDPSEN